MTNPLPTTPAQAATSGDARPPAWLLFGLPDDARARLLFMGWNQPPRIIMEGTASFLGQLRELPWAPQPVYFGEPGMAINAQLACLPCINFMADADIYPLALRQAAAFVEEMQVPCFNHPQAVLGTTREGVFELLKSVPGLHVPMTVRVRADTVEQLQAEMEKAGISYPVLVRMSGDHGGVSTARVDDAGSWDAINPLPWGGRDVYLTQYVDYRDEDGFYRKLRIVIAGDAVLPRHQIVSRQWMVHAKNRVQESADEERAFLEGFESQLLPKIAATVSEVADRLGLDWFGIDASLRPDGKLLLFEANACMNSLFPTFKGPTMWDKPLADMLASLALALGNVHGWRHARAKPELLHKN